MTTTSAPERCPSCGLIGAPHGSEHECIFALRRQVAKLNAIIVALAKKKSD